MNKKGFYLLFSFVFLNKEGSCYVRPEQLFPNISPSHRVLAPEKVLHHVLAMDDGRQAVDSPAKSTVINGFDEFNTFMVMNQDEERFVVLKIDSVHATDASLRLSIFEQAAELFKRQGRFAVLNVFENSENDQLAYDLIAPFFAVQGKLLTNLHTLQMPIFLLFLPDEATGMVCKNLLLPEGKFSCDLLQEAIKSNLLLNKPKK